MNTTDAVAKRIEELRKELGITVYELSQRTGLPSIQIEAILRGKNEALEIIGIKKICDGLGVTLYQFFDTEGFDWLKGRKE